MKTTTFTERQLREAEHLLMFQATHKGPSDARARAKVTVALINLLDVQKHNWRAELAKEIQARLDAGELEDFDPERPFDLAFANTDEMLATLSAGHITGLDIKEHLGTKL